MMRGQAEREIILQLLAAGKPRGAVGQPWRGGDDFEISWLRHQAARYRFKPVKKVRRGVANLVENGIRADDAGPEK